MKRKFLSIQNKNLSDFGVPTYKALWAKAQAEGYEGISITVATKFAKKASDGDKKLFHAIFSSAVEDRHGEIVYQVFDLSHYKNNPVYLDSHNYDSIEHIIGKVHNIEITDMVLQGDIEFATGNPKGALAEYMAENGFLNTSSIGFIPKKFDDKGNILESEMLEISGVSVPANPEALFEKGIETEEEEPIIEPEKVPEVEPKTPEDDIKEDVVETVKPKKSKKSIVVKALSEIVEDRKRLIKTIQRDLQEMTEENKPDRKQKIFKALRELESQS